MDDIVEARHVLHAVAEHLLAGPQWRHTGEIALTVTDGGFGTTTHPAPGVHALEVRGRHVLAEPGGIQVPIAGSVREMATAIGIEPGAPMELYREHATLSVDDALMPDDQALALVLEALIAGAQALQALSSAHDAILWPEHFDVGITIDEVNYGVSPGDSNHDLPYAYVGPWTPRTGPFWNEPFGASRPVGTLHDIAEILAFFEEGRGRAS